MSEQSKVRDRLWGIAIAVCLTVSVGSGRYVFTKLNDYDVWQSGIESSRYTAIEAARDREEIYRDMRDVEQIMADHSMRIEQRLSSLHTAVQVNATETSAIKVMLSEIKDKLD